MKQLFLLLNLIPLISFGYFDTDVGYASLLAEGGIINQQSEPVNYRLDDQILRQEVIGMAIKVKGISLPDNYKCKKYFSDATQDDWVCRALEIAADNGIISRANKTSRAKDSITPEEATAMFMSAKGITYPKNTEKIGQFYSYEGKSQWEIDLHEGIVPLGITIAEDSESGNALRKNVFHTVYQILSYEPGLKFIPCGVSDEKAHISLGVNEFDISDFGDSGDCRGIGYGKLFYRDGSGIYATVIGEIAAGGLAVLDTETMTGELIGYGQDLSSDGKTLIWFTQNDSISGLQILEIKTNTKHEYELPQIRGVMEEVIFSDDKNMIGIFAVDFGGNEARVYILDRASKKTTTHDFILENDYFYSLSSVSGEGKYTLEKVKY